MKNYYNYIFEGKINDVKEKYKDKVPEKIMDYFLNNQASSILFEAMLNYYVDNKDNKKYEKLQLEKFIFELVRLFQEKKEHLSIKDITKIKTLDELKNLISIKYEKKYKKNSYNLGVYYDGQEYLICSPLDFETAFEYGDHAWCINREPKHFYDDSYRASYGAVIQCLNKINPTKNLAIQITNLNQIYGYDRPTGTLEINIWDENDNEIYTGSYEHFKEIDEYTKTPVYVEWCEEWNITAIKEIMDVLNEIEENGIDPDKYVGENIDDLWNNFQPSFEQAFNWAKKYEKMNDLFLHILHEAEHQYHDKEILVAISNLFFLDSDSVNKPILIDVLSTNLPYEKYLKKYNLNYTGQKIPRMVWEFIYKNISYEEIKKIIKDEDLNQQYVFKLNFNKKNKQQLNLKLEKRQNNIAEIIYNLSEEESEKYLNILDSIVELNDISYGGFVNIDLDDSSTMLENWKIFKSMLNY